MNIRELLFQLDEIIPFKLAETWDNAGLMIGDNEMPVSDICLTLDATPEVVDLAAKSKCDVIITHHPLIFNPISTIDTSSMTGAVIKKTIKNDMALISLHTNWDKSGLNDTLARALNLNNISSLQPGKKEEDRIGVIGELPQKESPVDFLRIVKDAWNLSHVIYHEAESKKSISRVAICGGSGSELWADAFHENADVYITAEVKHHHRLEAVYKGMPIIEADHYEMESYSLASLRELLIKTTKCSIKIINPSVKTGALHNMIE